MTDRRAQCVRRPTLPVSPYLFLEVGGTEAGVAGDLETARELAAERARRPSSRETDPTARARMWGTRHSALMASLALAPGSRAMTTDVAVPVSRARCRDRACAARARGDRACAAASSATSATATSTSRSCSIPSDAASVVAGEGAERPDRRGRARARRHVHRRARHRLRQDRVPRTASTATSCRSTRGIKQLFDPNGIMNPGKVVPASS